MDFRDQHYDKDAFNIKQWWTQAMVLINTRSPTEHRIFDWLLTSDSLITMITLPLESLRRRH